MTKTKFTLASVLIWFVVGLSIVFGLQGCGGTGAASSAASMISGSVMGGRQPINGSKVYVFAASGSSAAAPQLIGSATTGSSGTFSITSFSPTPTTGDLIYAVAIGGDAGGGTNTNATLMSVVGVYGSALSNVQINELTSVAAMSQLNNHTAQIACSSISGNSGDTTGSMCPSINGQTSGWSSVVTAVSSMVSSSTGQVVSANNSTIQSLNLQASVMANCINSNGATTTGTACTNLYNNAAPSDYINLITGTLSTSSYSTGSGPQKIAISPNGLYIYVTSGNTVSAYKINSTGTSGSLTPVTGTLSTSTYTTGTTGNYSEGVAVSPDSRYVFVANGSDNTISAFAINSTGTPGSLTPVTGTLSTSTYSTSISPMGIAISPNGLYAYVTNYSTGTVSAYTINSTGTLGSLTPVTGTLSTSSYSTGTHPYNIAISPNGLYAYVTNAGSNTVSAYTINSSGTPGSLTPVTGTLSTSSYSTGSLPYGLAISSNGYYAYVANFSSSTVSAYTINSSGTPGSLTPVTGTLSTSSYGTGSDPQTVVISPNGLYAYVLNYVSNTVSAYSTQSPAKDSLSSLTYIQANVSHDASRVFGIAPVSPVYTPIPSSAPATLALP